MYDPAGNLINYTILEKEVNTDDLALYDSEIVYGENSATITNTFVVPDDKTSVQVTKVWDDN